MRSSSRAVAVAVATLLLGALAPAAVADQATPDGDSQSNNANLSYGGASGRSCDSRGSAVTGSITVKYNGSQHFTAGENLTVTFTTPAGVSVTSTPRAVPSPWNNTAPDFTIAVSTTVAPTSAGGKVEFLVTGATSGYVIGASGSGKPFFEVQVDCPTNRAPVANADSYATDEDTALTVTAPGVLGNDTDADGNSLTAAVETGPSHGSLTLGSGGGFTYTPNANFHGSDSFTYRAHDGTVSSAPVTVSLTVRPVNDRPVARDDSYSVNEDETLTEPARGVLGNDTDADGNPLTASLVEGPAKGSLTLNANGGFTYVPNANATGIDTFSYRVNDGTTDSAPATVTITLNAVNDPPAARNDTYNVNEDETLEPALGVLDNDNDPDDDPLTAALVSGPDHGPDHGAITLNADGTFKYTPDANFNGVDSFTYRASDGTADSSPATVTIAVGSVNDVPTADNDSYSLDEDAQLNVLAVDGLLNGDADVDGDRLTVSLVEGPTKGSLTLNPDGSFDYQPELNANGADSFTYEASDGTASSNMATVSLTIRPVNDAPVAVADVHSTDEDTPLSVEAPGVLGNDTDVDNAAGDLSASVVDEPTDGSVTLNADGSFDYTPDANFNGEDSFSYQVSDGALISEKVTVTITVTPVNDAPVVSLDPIDDAEEGDTVTLNGSFRDVDGEAPYTVTIDWGDSSPDFTQSISAAQFWVTGRAISAAHTYVDDEAGGDDVYDVTVTVTDSGVTRAALDPQEGTANTSVGVANVAPSVTAPVVSVNAVAGTVSLRSTFTDPAGENDDYAGSFDFDGTTVPGVAADGTVAATTRLHPGCHDLSTTATVTDGDGGAGTSPATTTSVDVVSAAFGAPIRDNVRNLAKYGSVVPVKVRLASSCTVGSTVTSETLNIQVVKGNVQTGDGDDTEAVVTQSVSSADSGTLMRTADGQYIYNLSTKGLTPGQDYTVLVRAGGSNVMTQNPVVLRALLTTRK